MQAFAAAVLYYECEMRTLKNKLSLGLMTRIGGG
jgi:hypothetical protein